ncbi:MAG: hypothetical protein P8I30_00335 [Flavobacteriaceae bacterium]|nr:hypothetical protein [Flavobacteriaceae bacterium]
MKLPIFLFFILMIFSYGKPSTSQDTPNFIFILPMIWGMVSWVSKGKNG